MSTMKKKSSIVLGTILGLLIGLPGCSITSENSENEDTGVPAHRIVPIGPQPITGIIDEIAIAGTTPIGPGGVSYLPDEESLLVTTVGPVKQESGRVWMARRRDKQFILHTLAKATAKYGSFAGHYYDSTTHKLYVCANPDDNKTKDPSVMVLDRATDGRFVVAGTIGIVGTNKSKTCGHITKIEDYLFVTNTTPSALTDPAIEYVKLTTPLPATFTILQTYTDLKYQATQIKPGVEHITDLKAKFTQKAGKYGIWVLSRGTGNFIGLDFTDNKGVLARVGEPQIRQPAAQSTSFLNTMVQQSEDVFIFSNRNKIFMTSYNSAGQIVKTTGLYDPIEPPRSMFLGTDRLHETTLPVLYILTRNSYSHTTLNVIEYGFDPNS